VTRVLGVHGVGNYRPGESATQAAEILARIWRGHLLAGPLAAHGEIDLAVAYYADHVQVSGRQASIHNIEDLPPDATEMLRSWLTEFGPPVGAVQGPGTWPLRQALSWLAQRRKLAPHLTESFVVRFFSEVATYLRSADAEARYAARDRVARAVCAHRPTIVLAHSLGSVVTFETFWAYPELNVGLLITLGSPLALPHAVFPRLEPAPVHDRGARPPGVQAWINLADPGDLVALPPRGISSRFSGVDLDDEAVIHAFDFHRVGRYLRCPRLAHIMHDCPHGH
jgi:hypothetical protein